MDEDTPGPMHTLCRTCLTQLKPDGTFDLFMLPGLAKKLCVCTSLSVEQQDGYPRNLCSSCYNRLNDFHDFQKQCVDAVQKFKELVTSSCFIIRTLPEDLPYVEPAAGQEQETNDFDPLLNTKVEIDNEEDVFKLIEQVDKESDEEQDQEEEEDNAEDAFNDSGSDFNQNQEEAAEQHSSDSDDDEMPLSRLRGTKRTAKCKTKKNEPKAKRKRIPAAERHLHRTFECDICQQKFIKLACYEEHMKRHSEPLPYQCEAKECQRGFSSTTGLKHHMEHAHPELCQLHACMVDGCDESFAQTRMLTKHLRSVHNIDKPIIHPCPKCEKKFRCPMALKKHMYDHTGEALPFGCTVCQKRFRVNTELRDHLLRHAGIKKFVCFHCGVGRTTKQELDKHMLIHTTEKKFKCDHCEHTSHNKQRMNKHIKAVHMKIRDFVCQYCPKTFASSCACKNHEKLHTGDDCFECTICGRKFLFESRLTKHLRTHANRSSKSADSGVKQEKDQDVQEAAAKEVVKVPEIPVKPKDPRRIEVVDIAQLAGTSVNPIPSVSVSSWSPQEDFAKNEGQLSCPDCGNSFTTLGGLKSHIKAVHNKIRDYACRFCPKRFSKTYTLKHHEYTHTGEKPYECHMCNQRYRHDATFRKHLESHSRPPKEPKEPKRPKRKSLHPQEPRVKLNTEPQKNYEQYQDPDAERAAATAQLMAQQLEESEAKRKAEEKAREIQEAACEQLQQLNQLPASFDGITK